MEKVTSSSGSLIFVWTVVTVLLSHNVLIHAKSAGIEDQKNYYSDPNAPPGVPHGSSPPHVNPPSHGPGGTPHGSPPHGNPPPHGSGGGSYYPPPSTPSGGDCGTPPSTPGSDGGSYHYPPSAGGTPPTPVIVSPPSGSTTPTPRTPTPPFLPDPNTPFTGTCNYWRSHPGVVWGLLGWWGTLGSAFGVPSVPGFGAHLSLQQALSNTRNDGLGALYREGTASLLNSMVNNRFPYTTKEVRQNFVSALGSNKAAAAQAQLFKLANEGRLKPRA
ncbi:protodermal factor 1 [Juglans regia]|uniref:Protodermal factor 1 n=2 Tax=Juglans regia TaxID=51240 RepID=A0A2I4EX53_JUGRE|nr:protodermal factor 1 [Juglans regia]